MKLKRTRVLIVCSENGCAQTISQAFSRVPESFEAEHFDRLSSTLDSLAQRRADVILLELALADSEGLSTFLKVQESAQGAPIIVLSGLDDPDLALEAIQAGAQDYLVKGRMNGPSLLRCVRHTVERHRHVAALLTRARHKPRGDVISFIGVKGGVGTTTAVLNVAAALGQRNLNTVALELDAPSGFAHHLGRSPSKGAAGILEMAPADISSHELDKRLTRLPSGFRVLFGQSGSDLHQANQQQAAALIHGAAATADYVLADLSARISTAHEAVVRASRHVCLVLEPDLLCLRAGKELLKLIGSWGLHSSACGLMVVNKQTTSNPMKLQDVRSHLGTEIVGRIPPAAETCLLAAEAGKPLLTLRPESLFSSAILEATDGLVQNPVRTMQL